MLGQRQADIAAAEIARMVKHELSPLIGLLEFAMSREINQYPTSDSQVKLSQLKRRIEGIAKLSVLNEEPTIEQFDLAQLIRDEIKLVAEGDSRLLKNIILADISQEIWIFGPRGWIEIVVSNALRNAVEALPKGDTVAANGVQITAMELGNLLVINIAGIGNAVSREFRSAYQVGLSSKGGGRIGTGLVFISRISERLGAEWNLVPLPDGNGSVFEFVMPMKKAE